MTTAEEKPIDVMQRRDRIHRALIRAKKKLTTTKRLLSSKSKSQPIRLELIEQTIIAYAELTKEERMNFMLKVTGQQKENAA